MVSCYGSNLTPYNWTIEMEPAQPNKPFTFEKDTIIDYISSNKQKYSYFLHLLLKGATAPLLNSLSVNYTVFLPSNNAIENTFGIHTENVIKNMDKYTAKEIVLYHILPMFVPLNVLQSSQAMYLKTKINLSIDAKILCQTDSRAMTVLNNRVRVLHQINKDKPFLNGLLLETDKLLIPPAFETTFKNYITC